MRNIILISLFLILLIGGVFALSETAIASEKLIEQARENVFQLQLKGIPFARANESLQEAMQIYSAQIALENLGRSAKYDLVEKYANEVFSIKENAINANDELRIFLWSYSESNRSFDLTEFQPFYQNILNSYYEERFEETVELINEGYDKLSEIESKQTTLNLFYAQTTRSIKDFVYNNKYQISVISLTAIILILIFWKTFTLFKVRRQLNYLNLRKTTLHNLIKNLQKDYFVNGSISEVEYFTKLKKFEELIRDIDRQIPLLNEELVKLKTNKSSSKRGLANLELEKLKSGKKRKKNPWWGFFTKKKVPLGEEVKEPKPITKVKTEVKKTKKFKFKNLLKVFSKPKSSITQKDLKRLKISKPLKKPKKKGIFRRAYDYLNEDVDLAEDFK